MISDRRFNHFFYFDKTSLFRRMHSYYLFTLVLLQLHRWTDSQTIHVCTSGNGEQCDIDCETSDQTVNILFTHPIYGTAGGCTSGGSCQSGLGLGYTVARVNSTFTRLTIPSLNRTTDRGNWTCSYGSSASLPVFLPSPSPLGNGTQISVIGTNVTCQLNCQSPISGFTSLQIHYIQDGNTSLLYNVTSISGSTPSAADGCSNDEQNIILTRDVSSSTICGSAKFQCIFTNIYLGSANSSISSDVQLEGCWSSTVLSSTVQTSTPKPSPVCQPCLISGCLLLWQCILIWIVIGVAVIILISCCIFCLWKKRQKSEKKPSTKNNKMQNLKDKKRNNKTFDDKTENKDRTDMKSVDKYEKKQNTENNKMQNFEDRKRNNKAFDDKTENKDRTDMKSVDKYEKKQNTENNKMQNLKDKSRNNKEFDDKTENKDRTVMNSYDMSGYDKSGSGYDNSGYDKSGYDKFGYDKSGYDKSGYDNYQFYRGNRM